MNELLLYTQLYTKLSKQIRTLPPGTKLPTVRTIMKSNNVSLSTVNKALDCLRSENLVRSLPGSGIYTCDAAEPGYRRPVQVDILFSGYEESLGDHGYVDELIHSLSQQYGQQSVGVRVSTISPDDSFESARTLIDRLVPEAIITINLYNADILHYLVRQEIPYVNLTPNLPRQLENSVYVDNESIVAAWLEYLTARGHRRIVFLHGVTDLWYLRDMHEREKCFYRECARHGVIPDGRLIAYGGYTPQEAYEAIAAILNNGHRFTAVIVNDHIVSGVYRCLQDHGFRVGKDVSVIGVDDIELSSHMIPALTTVRIPRRQLAEKARELLAAAMDGQRSQPCVAIPGQLVERESVVAL